VVVAIAAANPIATVIVSEFQAAPDSLEFIELHPYSWPGSFPSELGGLCVVTNGGVAVVDSGVRFENESSYVVVNRSNTTGTFSLGDDSDYVRLCLTGSYDTLRLRYPANPYRQSELSWTPPPGTSASILQWWEWDPSGEWYDVYTWYIDKTPTPGTPNDDTLGGICGHVVDDRGLPVNGATVRITATQGTAEMTSGAGHYWPAGYFEQKPTGPGTFTVTADCPGYLPGAYPDTIVLAPNELREITVSLDRVGMAENSADANQQVALRQRGRTLVLTADRPGTALASVYDNLGRVRMSENVRLVPGSNEVPLRGLSSGVYFAGCVFRGKTLKQKLVLY
jgi:hypothetical protein